MKSRYAVLAIMTLFAFPALAANTAKPVSNTAATSVSMELQDGTKMATEGSNVFIIAKDGSRIPAPDGSHTLKNGSSITVKNGKKLN